jgi:hypothetical protein
MTVALAIANSALIAAAPHASAAVGIDVGNYMTVSANYVKAIHWWMSAVAAAPTDCPNEPGDGSNGPDTLCTYNYFNLEIRYMNTWAVAVYGGGVGPTNYNKRLDFHTGCAPSKTTAYRAHFSQKVSDYVAPFKPTWNDERFNVDGYTPDCRTPDVHVEPLPPI